MASITDAEWQTLEDEPDTPTILAVRDELLQFIDYGV